MSAPSPQADTPDPRRDRRAFLRRGSGALLGAVTAGWSGLLTGCRIPTAEVYEPSPHNLSGDPTPPPSILKPEATPRAPETDPARPLLPIPDLADRRIVRAVAGLRPYRRGGVRLGRTTLPDGRTIVHNYGHGGAGITLSWGCAEEVRDLLEDRAAAREPIAVLGAGIVGMTAAHVLREVGHPVTVYAESFSPQTTSDIAGGQFAPSLVDFDRGRERAHRMERVLRRSYRRFSEHLGATYGVFRRDNYATPGHGTGLARIPAGILPRRERLPVLPFPGPPRRGSLYRTLLIEPPRYLPKLMSDLGRLGVGRERRTFSSLDDVTNLSEPIVVNCLGLGARTVFRDTRVIPVRGQLLHLEPQELPYLLSHEGYLFPRSDALILGGTAEWNVSDPRPNDRAVARILRRHRAFFGVES